MEWLSEWLPLLLVKEQVDCDFSGVVINSACTTCHTEPFSFPLLMIWTASFFF